MAANFNKQTSNYYCSSAHVNSRSESIPQLNIVSFSILLLETKLRARSELQILPTVLDGWRNAPFFHYFDQNERDFMLVYA